MMISMVMSVLSISRDVKDIIYRETVCSMIISN